MRVGAISMANYRPLKTNLSQKNETVSTISYQNNQPSFEGKGLATVGAIVGGIGGFLLGGPIGAAAGAALMGTAGAAGDDKAEYTESERFGYSHYD